jgi:hypothetical protein
VHWPQQPSSLPESNLTGGAVFEENVRLFQEYDRYWFHGNPSFYKVVVVAEKAA